MTSDHTTDEAIGRLTKQYAENGSAIAALRQDIDITTNNLKLLIEAVRVYYLTPSARARDAILVEPNGFRFTPLLRDTTSRSVVLDALQHLHTLLTNLEAAKQEKDALDERLREAGLDRLIC